jgi:hypothetical protein
MRKQVKKRKGEEEFGVLELGFLLKFIPLFSFLVSKLN